MASVFKWRAEERTVCTAEVQRQLAHWNRGRLSPRLPDENCQRTIDNDRESQQYRQELW